MIWKASALFLVGMMAFGGTTTALTMGSIKVTDSFPCQSGGSAVFKTYEIEAIVGPGAKIVLAGSPSGSGGFRLSGYIEITVRHVDGSAAQAGGGGIAGSDRWCGQTGAGFNGPWDVTSAFQPGLNLVQLSVVGGYCGPCGFHHIQSDATYLVALSGHMVIPLR